MENKNEIAELSFDDRTGKLGQLEGMFQKLLEAVAFEEKMGKTVVESLTLADDETVQKLNKEYRGTDRPTDVISFAFNEASDVEKDLPVTDLGDIIISVDTAKRQAKEFNHPLCRELAFLFLHGTLHALGYDHVRSEQDAKIMFALQNKLLNGFAWDWDNPKWGLGRALPTPDEKKALLLAAKGAGQKAMSPYSGFKVGAALLLGDGRIVTGFNIESPAFGCTMCAERSAVYATLTQVGPVLDQAKALAVYGSCERPVSPCGQCRQVLADFFPQDFPVYLSGDGTEEKDVTVGDLLPYVFRKEDMAK